MNKILFLFTLLLLFAVTLTAQVISVSGATPKVRAGLTEPTILPSDKTGDKYFITQDGTPTGNPKNSWTYNGTKWMLEGAAFNEAIIIRAAQFAEDTFLATEKAVRTSIDLSATRNFKTITQVAHGFTVGQWLYFDGTQYALASTSSLTTLNTVGVVEQVIDANNFVVVTSGISTIFTGLTPNTIYYLDATAGAITTTKPATSIRVVLTSLNSTDGLVNQYSTVDDATTQALTSGRVNALLDLASTTHINTDPGTKIPFTGTVYTNGMTTNAGSIIPSVTGKYRADWLCMAASTEFLADGIFFVVQNGVSVGQVSYNMNEASAVNQSAGFIDVTLVADQEVSLHYRTRHTASDGISWDRGSYFQLTQLPTAVAPIVNTVAEYGENNGIVNNQSTASTAFVDVTGGSFTLPSAGVWEVQYNLTSSGNSVGNRCRYQLVRASDGAVVANSSAGFVYPVANHIEHVSQKSFITTTGADVYKLQFRTDGGTLTLINANDNTGGNSKITWSKIAGQLPSTGTTVDYVNARLTANQLIASGAAFPFVTQTGNIPNASGVFTLSAGKTYRLTAAAAYLGTEGSTGITVRWKDITNNTFIGSQGTVFSTNVNTVVSSLPITEAVITPTANIQVRFEHQDATGKTFVGGGGNGDSWATIVQLGSTSNTVGTLPAVDQSSAGYFDIGNMRMQWGTGTTNGISNVTLPAAFANTNYRVTSSFAGSGSIVVNPTGTKTTATFQVNSFFAPDGGPSGSVSFDWFAFGQKP